MITHQAKVSEFDLSEGPKEDIRRLEVTVDNALGVNVGETWAGCRPKGSSDMGIGVRRSHPPPDGGAELCLRHPARFPSSPCHAFGQDAPPSALPALDPSPDRMPLSIAQASSSLIGASRTFCRVLGQNSI